MSYLLAAGSTGDPLIDWLAQAGAGTILALVVVLFIRGTLVRGKDLDLMRADRDRAMDMVFKLAEAAKRAIDVAEEKRAEEKRGEP